MRIAEENWKVLASLLPTGWQQMAWQSGAVDRLRGFPSTEVLLRVLLLYVARGYSLRETVVRSKLANWAVISDVALLKRLRNSEDWLRWLCTELLQENVEYRLEEATSRTIPIVDGTIDKVPRLVAACVQYERATARFNRRIGACIAKRVRSK